MEHALVANGGVMKKKNDGWDEVSTIEWVKKIRQSSYVERVHTVPTIDRQNLGHHQYNVFVLAMAICSGDISANLIKGCMFHDTHELESGDPPANVCWKSKKLKEGYSSLMNEFRNVHKLHFELTEDEESILHWADKMEFSFYCIDQIELGNRNMWVPLNRSIHHMKNEFIHIGNTDEILGFLTYRQNDFRLKLFS